MKYAFDVSKSHPYKQGTVTIEADSYEEAREKLLRRLAPSVNTTGEVIRIRPSVLNNYGVTA